MGNQIIHEITWAYLQRLLTCLRGANLSGQLVRESKQGKAIVGTTRSNRLEYQEADQSNHALLCLQLAEGVPKTDLLTS